MEQAVGTPPYRFEVLGPDEARIVEVERNGFFGQWKTAKRGVRWVTVRTRPEAEGTLVEIEASAGEAPASRARELMLILDRGMADRRTIYRDRSIPLGPVSLVASWAGTGYRLYTAPGYDAKRGAVIHTATQIEAIEDVQGGFVRVRTGAGDEGFVERDQIVPAPDEATRLAQIETARFG